ncbi:MAG: hypothetical protein LBM59_04500 [Ruminococcus sp.]|nr:hypothetical protein [Ruminococcus sp.]
MKRRAEILIIILFTAVYGGLLIYFARDVAAAIRESVRLCLYTIIPSLYAFMVLSSFIISTGIYTVLSKPFSFLSRKIFHIPTRFFSIFLLASAAGYPVGAKLLSSLVKSGDLDNDTAADMQCFCYSGGPAFFCGAVSLTLFDNISLGFLIFGVIFTVNIICGIIIGLRKPVPPAFDPVKIEVKVTVQKFLTAVTDGGKSILIMCGIIIFFSSFTAILDRLGFFTIISLAFSGNLGISNADGETLIKSVVEINNILSLSRGQHHFLPAVTALLSFGGVCVLMQILQFSGGYIKFIKFILYRIFAAVVCFFLTKTVLILFPSLTAVLADTVNGGFTKGTPIPAIFLIFMSIILLTFEINTKRKRLNSL